MLYRALLAAMGMVEYFVSSRLVVTSSLHNSPSFHQFFRVSFFILDNVFHQLP